MLLHLVDGTYELFRAYFGRPPRSNPQGHPVGAVHGLLDSMISLLRESGVTHVAVAFDTVIESFRNDLFTGYKTGEGIEPELWAQFPIAEEGLRALGLTVWSMVDFEADDAMATAALRWVDDVEQVMICSPDKDMTQAVIADRVVTYDRMRQVLLDEEGVHGKFGVAPDSIPDYLALVGDTADGVPGVPSWGAKSASAVLAEYHRLDRIPLDENEWTIEVRGASRLAENLRTHLADAKLYRTLTTLRRDVPIQESLEDLEWQGVPRAIFDAFCDAHGFDTIRDRVPRWS